MSRKPRQPNRRVGRPPGGARGERVKDYPQLSIRLPVEVKAKLQAMSLVSAQPQWRLVSEAIECYLRDRPDAERRIVEKLSAAPRSRPGKGRRKPPPAG